MTAKSSKAAKKPRAVSLFSGCGGSDLALQTRGFEIVWANDIWELACETYRDNIKNPTIEHGDISDFDDFPEAELLVGCYPCQGYSQGGRRSAAADPTNFLYRHFDRALRIIRPRAFVVENVNGMAYGENAELLGNQLHRYRLAGYRVAWKLLDAASFGVAQTRRRVFIVGIRSDLKAKHTFPVPTHGPGREEPFRGQRAVIGDLPPPADDALCPDELSWYYMSRNRRRTWSQPSACIVGHWRAVPLHPSSPTLEKVGRDAWRFKGKGRPRRLSYEECALLQGFPRDWKWKRGRLRDRFQLIGNAVPPPLFDAVLNSLPDVFGAQGATT